MPVDLLAIGTPTIEVIDPKPGGKVGSIMDYKKRGLALSAKNYEELKERDLEIINSKDEILKNLIINYNEYFAPIGKPIQTIAEDICVTL